MLSRWRFRIRSSSGVRLNFFEPGGGCAWLAGAWLGFVAGAPGGGLAGAWFGFTSGGAAHWAGAAPLGPMGHWSASAPLRME